MTGLVILRPGSLDLVLAFPFQRIGSVGARRRPRAIFGQVCRVSEKLAVSAGQRLQDYL